MKRVLKIHLIGHNDIRSSCDYELNAPWRTLFRKDGSTTKQFGKIMQELLEDASNGHGMITLRYDWDV